MQVEAVRRPGNATWVESFQVLCDRAWKRHFPKEETLFTAESKFAGLSVTAIKRELGPGVDEKFRYEVAYFNGGTRTRASHPASLRATCDELVDYMVRAEEEQLGFKAYGDGLGIGRAVEEKRNSAFLARSNERNEKATAEEIAHHAGGLGPRRP